MYKKKILLILSLYLSSFSLFASSNQGGGRAVKKSIHELFHDRALELLENPTDENRKKAAKILEQTKKFPKNPTGLTTKIQTILGNLYFMNAGLFSSTKNKKEDYEKAYKNLKNSSLRGQLALSKLLRYGFHNDRPDPNAAILILEKAIEDSINLLARYKGQRVDQQTYHQLQHHKQYLNEFYCELGLIHLNENKIIEAIYYLKKSSLPLAKENLQKIKDASIRSGQENLFSQFFTKETETPASSVHSHDFLSQIKHFTDEMIQADQMRQRTPLEELFLSQKKIQYQEFLKREMEAYKKSDKLENLLELINTATMAQYLEWIPFESYEEVKSAFSEISSKYFPVTIANSLYQIYLMELSSLKRDNPIELFSEDNIEKLSAVLEKGEELLEQTYIALSSLIFFGLDKRGIEQKYYEHRERYIQALRDTKSRLERVLSEAPVARDSSAAAAPVPLESHLSAAEAAALLVRESEIPKVTPEAKKKKQTISQAGSSGAAAAAAEIIKLRDLTKTIKQVPVSIEEIHGVKFLFLTSGNGKRAKSAFLEQHKSNSPKFQELLKEIIEWRWQTSGTGKPEVLRGLYSYGRLRVKGVISRRLSGGDRILYLVPPGSKKEIWILEVEGHYTSR